MGPGDGGPGPDNPGGEPSPVGRLSAASTSGWSRCWRRGSAIAGGAADGLGRTSGLPPADRAGQADGGDLGSGEEEERTFEAGSHAHLTARRGVM